MTTEIRDARTEAAVMAELATRAAEPVEVEHGDVFLIDSPNGKQVLEVPALPLHADRATNTRTVTNAEAFIEYVTRHGDHQTEVWADAKNNRVVAVIDAHADIDTAEDERFGWEKHKVILVLEHTPAWNAWVNGQAIRGQVEFAEHIEEYAENVVEPSSAELLEIAQTLQGARKADFTSGTRLSNGEIKFQYVEEVQGKAGKHGDLIIPEEFKVALNPYIGGEGYRVTAKLRWRLDCGNVSIYYKLLNLDLVLEAAFADVVKAITERVEFPVFNGRP
ncbi:MAG: DUF2303 family protein [Leucobacter sp.]